MKLTLLSFLALVSLPLFVCAQENKSAEVHWMSITNDPLKLNGLPSFKENAPELWRLPKSAKDKVPARVWARAVAPDGGRIRFASDTSRVMVRAEHTGEGKKHCFIDTYIDGSYAGSAELKGTNVSDLILFTKKDRALRQITIYLPHNNEVRVLAIGMDTDAKVEAPRPFAIKQPIVCYGSSVLQGSGAAHPSKTYPAILARALNCDFVNLGFGGAGKAEPQVVDLVNQLDACCFLFDLGKSYGDQTIEPFQQMLATIRKAHPSVPIFCITPIYSVKEEKEPGYRERSENLRTLMRQAAMNQQKAGDKAISVVEGLTLFGPGDKEFLSDPLHPGDEGNERLAGRLTPLVKEVLHPSTPAQK